MMQIAVQFQEGKVGIDAKFISSTVSLDTDFTQSNVSLDTEFANFQLATVREDVEPYMGEYKITPKVDAQTIPTAQKYMTDNVHVKAIPYFETSNNMDGYTVYIGSEV